MIMTALIVLLLLGGGMYFLSKDKKSNKRIPLTQSPGGQERSGKTDIQDKKGGSGKSGLTPTQQSGLSSRLSPPPPPPPTPMPPPPPAPTTIPTPSQHLPFIKKFVINDKGEVAFADNIAQIQKKLECGKVKLAGLRDRLPEGKVERKKVERHLNELDKILKNLEKYDSDEISEKAAGMYFYSLKNIFDWLHSLYRGRDDSWRIPEINSYLSEMGVWSELILPGHVMSDRELEMMNIVYITANAGKSGIIEDVERLPYFIRFIDEDGRKDTLCSEGRMTVYKEE